MAGVTINDLQAIAASDFTVTDELPVWDTGAGSGVEPTKKITAQNLANRLAVFASTYVSGTLVGSTTIPPGGDGSDPVSINIPRGIWVISGGHEWAEDFTDLCIVSLRVGTSNIVGSVVRYSGVGNGGGINTCVVFNNSSEQNVYLHVWQNSSSNKTIKNYMLKAVKICDY